MTKFSGSYHSDDVELLLKQLKMNPISDISAKERLLQNGKHYSELIGVEAFPSSEYMRLFEISVADNLDRMARDLWALARRILLARPNGVVLVSFARAGTPIGVALRRLLRDGFGLDAPHYSISIIRDRGIDKEAIRYITSRHNPAKITFIDGWTGKGAIALELSRTLRSPDNKDLNSLADELFVLVDLAGIAAACGSTNDYLIPSAILNATVSGLVSRTILNELISPGDFHGCLFYDHLIDKDRSRWFVDRLHTRGMELLQQHELSSLTDVDPIAAQRRNKFIIESLMDRFDINDRNYIKPGIGEATRALLRRTTGSLILKNPENPCIRHLQHLAKEREVEVIVVPDFPLEAAAIIKRLAHV